MSASRYRHFPALRWPLEIQYQELDGKRIIVLSCPLGITEHPLGLHVAVAPLLQQFQGRLSVAEITEQFREQGCTSALLEELIELLDKHLFLESPRFRSASQRVREEFAQSLERPAYLAGLGYSASPGALTAELEGFLHAESIQIDVPSTPLLGLVSPHIDYRRGGICYGITWDQLRHHTHDVYLLMGTSHQYSDCMFHLTRKDFVSPLGTLPTDQSFIEALAQQYGPMRSFADEFLHRREHSLELQIPFLRHLKKSPAIAPILVSSFHNILTSGKRPQDFEPYEAFITALTEVCRTRLTSGARLCIIAGVDMAHVGAHFGDSLPLSPEFMHQVEQRDRAYLYAIESQNKSALWEHIAEDADRRRICGFPTMYTIIDLLDRLQLRYAASLFDYRQAVDYHTQCAVTFAGMGLYLQR